MAIQGVFFRKFRDFGGNLGFLQNYSLQRCTQQNFASEKIEHCQFNVLLNLKRLVSHLISTR